MRKLLAVFIITTVYQVAMANRSEKVAYIERYQAIAVQEMHRAGIPASIKLAQAILESDAGKSVLALQSNNHFGIKCGVNWSGKKAFKKDDDYRRGRLIKSCFRKYDSPEHSFIAHSDFLVSQPRYAFLFQIEPTNYRKWAKGLKKAGYASDPNYANRLISIIESYQLYQFDRGATTHSRPLIFEGEVELIDFEKPFQYINDVKSIRPMDATTVERIADQNNLSVRRVLKYNEHLRSENQTIFEGELIYLQPKRKQYRGRQKSHIVHEGETMQYISQKYGVRLDQLYRRNQMEENTQPAVGSEIVLRGKRKSGAPALRLAEIHPTPSQPKDSSSKQLLPMNEAIVESEVDAKSIVPSQVIFYTVKSGDTLYGLSKKFKVSVEELKQINRIENDMIKVGQKIQVSLK